MFNDLEHDQLSNIYLQCLVEIKSFRKVHNVLLDEVPLNKLYQPFFELYKQFTQQDCVFEPSEVMSRHQLSRWKAYKHEN